MRREDFESEAAWQYWRTLETSHLSQLMLVMVQFNPELAKSTPSEALPATNGRPGSVYSHYSSGRPDSYYASGSTQRHTSVSSRHSVVSLGPSDPDGLYDALDGDDDIQVGFHFTFIPPNPRKYYKRLLEYCIAADLEAMLSPAVGDDDKVSLGILSASHIELINECALRWRIGQPYRVACFLDIVRQFYERNEVPLECVPEALNNITRVLNEIELEKWARQDVDYLAQIYGGLFSTFLSHLYHTLESLPQIKSSDLAPYLSILETVRDSGLLERYDVDVAERLTEIQNQVKEVSARFYGQKLQELQQAPGVNRALPLLLMTDEIEKNAKLLDKRFPEPILGYVVTSTEYSCAHYIRQASRYRVFDVGSASAPLSHGLGRLQEATLRGFDERSHARRTHSGHLLIIPSN